MWGFGHGDVVMLPWDSNTTALGCFFRLRNDRGRILPEALDVQYMEETRMSADATIQNDKDFFCLLWY